ncbi:MFS transporter [Streptomyces sp. NPDC026672]|uniref:MFS transporter n=1 Tax=unclassified Streptomyces TaxID=2593676 RepID=UPI00341065F8
MTTTTTAPGRTGRARPRAGISTALILLAQLMLILDATVVQVALPHIRGDLGFGAADLLWVVNAYVLPYGGLLLLGGRLGDVHGRFRSFRIGLALFVLASLLGGLAPTAGVLLVARAAQGVGAALTAPSVLALLTVNAPDESARHRAFALFAAVTSGGLTLGLVLGGAITEVASWRWTLLINVPIGVAVLLLAPRFVVETQRHAGRFDVAGALTATLGSGALVFALVSAPDHGWGDPRTVVGLIAGAVLLLLLWIAERRSPHAMIDLSLLRGPSRTAALLANTFVIGAQMSTFYLTVQFLQSLGLDPLEAGLGFLPMSVGIFVMSRVAPKLVRRFGASPLILAGTALQAVALVLLATRVNASDDYLGTAFLPLLLDGLAIGSVMMPVTALAMKDVPAERAGSVSGMLQTTQQLGAATGLAVVVTVYASHAVPGVFLPGARPALLTAALLSALAFVAALVIAAATRRAARS